jgi:hypothetical protein
MWEEIGVFVARLDVEIDPPLVVGPQRLDPVPQDAMEQVRGAPFSTTRSTSRSTARDGSSRSRATWSKHASDRGRPSEIRTPLSTSLSARCGPLATLPNRHAASTPTAHVAKQRWSCGTRRSHRMSAS